MKQFLIALDQAANALLGGYADETLSARAYRTGSAWQGLINALFFDSRHCLKAYQSEFLRHQLPNHYRGLP